MKLFLRLVFLASALGPASAVAAPTFVVDSLVDAPGGANLSDGVCETAPGNGVCTLRAAVMEANAVAGGGATIRLPAGVYVLTRPPTEGGGAANGDLDLAAPLTILGAGPSATIIDGSDLDRVFASQSDPVLLRGLTVRNGKTPSGEFCGGGILNDGNLSLENVVVTDNEGLVGGGICSGGALELRHCIVEDNRAETGGGIAGSPGSVRIADSAIVRNSAGVGSGGGIANAAAMRIERTLIEQNYAEEGGGGIAGVAGELIVLNSTLHDNEAGTAGGGAVLAKAGEIQLIHATVTENRQTLLGPPGRGGLAVEPGASLSLRNSVVAGNLAPNGAGTGYVASECGSFENPALSGDYNLIGDRASCFLTGALAHVNASDVDPQLLPLAPNGGFARDRAGSGPTVRAIPSASCTDELGAPLREDQRGYARTGACDIGAVQVASSYVPPSPLRGAELIRNGGAEGNELGRATDGTGSQAAPYWSRVFDVDLTQIAYGAPGYPLLGDAPAGSGSYFFAGGLSALTSAFQLIDISELAAEIDAGTLAFTLEGAFGGAANEDDDASLHVRFVDATELTVGMVTIGGFTAADRGGVTRLLHDSERGFVPAGARTVELILESQRAAGDHNDGYADDLSLVLPEPSGWLLGAAAILTTLAMRPRPRRARAR